MLAISRFCTQTSHDRWDRGYRLAPDSNGQSLTRGDTRIPHFQQKLLTPKFGVLINLRPSGRRRTAFGNPTATFEGAT